MFDGGGARGQRGIGKEGVVAVLADGGRVLGLLAQLPLPFALEQAACVLRRRVGGAADEGSEQDDRGEEFAHTGP